MRFLERKTRGMFGRRARVGGRASILRRSFYDLTESTNRLRRFDRQSALACPPRPATSNAITELPAGHPYAGLDRSQVYTGLDFTVNGRLPAGATVFGGWTVQRTTSVDCDSLDDPNSFRFCNRGGGLDAESGVAIDMPFRHVFKMSGTVPLPYGVGFAVSYQSYPAA